MVKLGYLYKSKNDEKNATISFYMTREGENYLEENSI